MSTLKCLMGRAWFLRLGRDGMDGNIAGRR